MLAGIDLINHETGSSEKVTLIQENQGRLLVKIYFYILEYFII